LRTIDDAFLLGDNLLSAPIVEKGATGRDVYLPKGHWFNYWTQEDFEGGQTIHAEAPLDTLPLYVRAGAVIPLWPVQQYVGQAPVEELQLKAYAGNGEVTLYEDAGEGLDYQHGDYRWLYFTCATQNNGGLKLTWRRAGQYDPKYKRIRVEVFGIRTEPHSVRLDGQAAPLWYFENGIVEFTINTPFSLVEVIPSSENEAASTLLHPPRE
jgi:alpha-glucosidase